MHDDDCNSFAPCSREKTMYTDQIRFAAVSTLQASTVVESKRCDKEDSRGGCLLLDS